MHESIDSFSAAQRAVMELTTHIMCLAHQLGDPIARANMAVMEAIAHENDGPFENILVEVRYAYGKSVSGVHYWVSPVFCEANGFLALRSRAESLFGSVGRELVALDPVHITESDCWGMLVRLRT